MRQALRLGMGICINGLAIVFLGGLLLIALVGARVLGIKQKREEGDHV